MVKVEVLTSPHLTTIPDFHITPVILAGLLPTTPAKMLGLYTFAIHSQTASGHVPVVSDGVQVCLVSGLNTGTPQGQTQTCGCGSTAICTKFTPVRYTRSIPERSAFERWGCLHSGICACCALKASKFVHEAFLACIIMLPPVVVFTYRRSVNGSLYLANETWVVSILYVYICRVIQST